MSTTAWLLLEELDLWILAIYYGTLTLLSSYGAHRLLLIWRLSRVEPVDDAPESELPSGAPGSTLRLVDRSSPNRRKAVTAVEPSALPFVTVQLPVYEEANVVERLILAVAALDYPRDRFEIQVLDDSGPRAAAVAAEAVDAARERFGVQIEQLRRADRCGYKAGALAWGLEQARGELVAIFDADFVPSPDFLRRAVPRSTIRSSACSRPAGRI